MTPFVVNESGTVVAGQTLAADAGAALAGDSDPDGDTLSVYGVQQSGTTTLAGGSVAGSYGELTLNADGSYTYVADNAAAIAAGAPLTDSFSYLVTDGKGASVTSTLNISLERPPVLATSGGTTATHQLPAVVDPGLTLSVPGGSLTSATVQVTGNFQSNEDLLAFNNSDNSLYGDIHASLTGGVLTLSSFAHNATAAQWQNALDAVTFQDTATSQAPNTSDRTITFTVNDGSLSVSATKTVSVVADSGPVVGSVANQSILHDTTLTFNATNGNQLSIAYPYAESLSVTLWVNDGTLTLPTTNGLSFAFGDTGTAEATMTFRGSLSDVNAALSGLSYTPGQNFVGADSLEITAADGAKWNTSFTSIDVNPRITVTSPGGLTNQTTLTMTGTVDVASAGTIVVYEGTTPGATGVSTPAAIGEHLCP
jgi:VCBS repeat-containing protein